MLQITQITGINAECFLEKFNNLINEIKEIKESVSKQTPAPEMEYLTRKEVKSILKVTYPTVSNWTKAGILKSYRIGNRVFFKQSEISELLNKKHKKHN